LQVGGSLSTGDHQAGLSDLDLVAVTDGPVTAYRQAKLRSIHETISAAAELLQHGCAIFEHEPNAVWAVMSAADVRQAVVEEMTGYWSWAAHRPWLLLSIDQIDLSVATMLRARHTLATGDLITKSAALTGKGADVLSAHLVQGVRARRDGSAGPPGVRLILDSVDAWRLTRRNITSRE
ncbi:nucleotidyltransferase domain-containing protein, partial [Nocardioides sp.]|uniref:nucleotidyltransferase domain-containing protein n=1 Tax=Nocardioides sp. TaxID=35761 RepID=UPI00286E4D75